MSNYDNYITGLYDRESPMNRAEINDCEEANEAQEQQFRINNLKRYHKEINALEDTKNDFGLTSDQEIQLKRLIFLRNCLIKEL